MVNEAVTGDEIADRAMGTAARSSEIGVLGLGKLADPVCVSLAKAGAAGSPLLYGWVSGQQRRARMRRQARWCVVGGWLLLSASAIVSCAVSISLSRNVQTLFADDIDGGWASMFTIRYTPWLLAFLAGGLVIGGVLGFLTGRFPGLRSTTAAIDWETASDAVARLLKAGCTYPQSFRTTASVVGQSPRRWLLGAAQRVESGQSIAGADGSGLRDAAMVELLVDAADSNPSQQWGLMSHHFSEVAARRLVLLAQSFPMITTLLSGFLLWVSISASLGWMWRATAQMIDGFRY